MTVALDCPRCGAARSPEATACASCGASFALPVVARPVAISPWRGARTGLVQGAALAGAGLILRFALQQGGRMLIRRMTGGRPSRAVAVRQLGKAELVEYNETHIVRRVWTRR